MLEEFKKLLYPEGIKCIICGCELHASSPNSLCKKCSIIENRSYCSKCGRFLNADSPPSNIYICEECDTFYKRIFTSARAPFLYDGRVKGLVKGFKYWGKRYLAEKMAGLMLSCLDEESAKADFMTFVPMYPAKIKSRGYNQAEELSRALSLITGIPVVPILEKLKNTKNTAGMTKSARFEALVGSISVLDGVTLSGQSILLIDDVFTTGATVGECVRNLKIAGAGKIFILTFATGRVLTEKTHGKFKKQEH